ncbi:hypothetical protein SOVF_081860 [Spinacia oleracea]|nr:hypothetical protein SOVF_081860 [Spinacia oleracea]
MDLPHDLILHDIVTRLPIKSILQYKSVSKQWYSSISSSCFGNAHFKSSSPNHLPFSCINSVLIQSKNGYFLYSFDEDKGERESCTNNVDYEKGLFRLDIDFDDEISLIGSCNGLVCFYSLSGYLIVLNPITHQKTKFMYPLLEGFRDFSFGFGYVSLNNDFKIVRISESEEKRGIILVHVYSLKTHKWKQVYDERIIHGYSLHRKPTLSGVLVNETLYWIMYEKGRIEKQGVLGFDLVQERFNEVSGLVPSDSYLSCFRFLGCMGGFLGMGRVTNRGDVSISVSKQNGQIEYIGLYRDMNLSSCCSVTGFTKSGKFFIQLGDQELGLVDPNSSPKKYTRVVRFGNQGSIRVLSYTPSLISPSTGKAISITWLETWS